MLQILEETTDCEKYVCVSYKIYYKQTSELGAYR